MSGFRNTCRRWSGGSLGAALVLWAASGACAQSPEAAFSGFTRAGAVSAILADLRRADGPGVGPGAAVRPPVFEISVDATTGMRWSFAVDSMIWESALAFCRARGATAPSLGELGTLRSYNLNPRPRGGTLIWHWSRDESVDAPSRDAMAVYIATGWADTAGKLLRGGVACLHPAEQ